MPDWEDAPNANELMNVVGEVGGKVEVVPTMPWPEYWAGTSDCDGIWEPRTAALASPCIWTTEYIKNGSPRIKVAGRFQSLPRYVAMKEHRSKLMELFAAPFTQREDPVGIQVYNLCGYSHCTNPDHLPIMFRQHRRGLDALRVEVDGVAGWWDGAAQFYSLYESFLYSEKESREGRESKRKHQRKVQQRMARRKRKYTEGERARAITMLSDGTVTIEMYKEMKAIFMGLAEDIFDQTIIIYATRAKAIREGNITPGYVPDHRTNPFKGFKTKPKGEK